MPTIVPAIAPVEAMLIAVGLRSIISHQTERITKAKLDRMRTLPSEVRRLSRSVVSGELDQPFYSDLDYRGILKDLAKGVQMQQVQDMIEEFPARYKAVGSALMILARQVVPQLADNIPTSSYQTIAGSKSLLPSDTRIWKFVSILELLDNPLLVFPLMSTGALLKSQAQAVRTLYPSLSAAIDAALFEATVKAKTKKKSFELPPRAERGVKAWMNKGPVPTSSLKLAQASVQKQGAINQQRAEAKRKAREDRSAVAAETPSQASDIR